jgi:hypothetical protein
MGHPAGNDDPNNRSKPVGKPMKITIKKSEKITYEIRNE